MGKRAPKLEMILERVGPGNGPEAFQLWACRGARKGCPKKRKKQKHCPDCILPDPNDTLGSVVDRIERGDA